MNKMKKQIEQEEYTERGDRVNYEPEVQAVEAVHAVHVVEDDANEQEGTVNDDALGETWVGIEFANRLLNRCSEIDPERVFTFDEFSFSIRDASGGAPLYLDKIYCGFGNGGEEEQSAAITYYAQVILNASLSVPSTYEEVKPNLMPKVVNMTHSTASQLPGRALASLDPIDPIDPLDSSGQSDQVPHVVEKISGNLGVALYCDMPAKCDWVSKDQLEKWGVSEEAATETARANLDNLIKYSLHKWEGITELGGSIGAGDDLLKNGASTPSTSCESFVSPSLAFMLTKPQIPTTHVDPLDGIVDEFPVIGSDFSDTNYPGLKCFLTFDAYGSSRILAYDHMQKVPVRGEIVAMVILGGFVLVTGTDEVEGLCAMGTVASEIAWDITSRIEEGLADEDESIMSAIAMKLGADGWSEYLPDLSHPAYDSLHNLALVSKDKDYAAQQEIMKSEVEANTPRHFIVCDERFDRNFSYTVWSENIPCVLPVTEYVGLHCTEATRTSLGDQVTDVDFLLIPWDRLMQVVGYRLKNMGVYPTRYQTIGFPNQDELIELRKYSGIEFCKRA